MSHHLQDLQRVVTYFGPVNIWIEWEFTASYGWRRIVGYKKRPSKSYLRKLRRNGVTFVGLTDGERVADFSIKELL